MAAKEMEHRMNKPLPFPDSAVRKTRIEQAEARAERAEARTIQAKTRIESAETRTEQAETRTEFAKTRTENAEIRTEQVETRAEQAESRAEQAETNAEQAEMRAELAVTALEGLVQKQINTTPVEASNEVEVTDLHTLERLTDRQREILQLLAKGENTKSIAAILKISPKTVEYHRVRLMNVVKTNDITGLVRFAIRMGLVPAAD